MTRCSGCASAQASGEPFRGAQTHWLKLGGDACPQCGGRAFCSGLPQLQPPWRCLPQAEAVDDVGGSGLRSLQHLWVR